MRLVGVFFRHKNQLESFCIARCGLQYYAPDSVVIHQNTPAQRRSVPDLVSRRISRFEVIATVGKDCHYLVE
jgi:hypothetical protein